MITETPKQQIFGIIWNEQAGILRKLENEKKLTFEFQFMEEHKTALFDHRIKALTDEQEKDY